MVSVENKLHFSRGGGLICYRKGIIMGICRPNNVRLFSSGLKSKHTIWTVWSESKLADTCEDGQNAFCLSLSKAKTWKLCNQSKLHVFSVSEVSKSKLANFPRLEESLLKEPRKPPRGKGEIRTHPYIYKLYLQECAWDIYIHIFCAVWSEISQKKWQMLSKAGITVPRVSEVG